GLIPDKRLYEVFVKKHELQTLICLWASQWVNGNKGRVVEVMIVLKKYLQITQDYLCDCLKPIIIAIRSKLKNNRIEICCKS
ncbi:MAG TPA: hypothetical protein VHO72_11030, partial [Bacteroidales bacterium]|nr:hypothetical protein [Bacteroidales bacterium]